MVTLNIKTKVLILRKRRTWQILALIALYITIMAGSWYVGNRRAAKYDAEERNKLRSQAMEIVNTINPEFIKQLTFTPADIGTPVFEQITRQMVAHKSAMHCKGIWTAAMRNGKPVFGPESYPLDHPFSTPPGTVYKEPTEQFCGIFKNGQTVIEGPYTDEFGPCVSSYSPILDSRSGEVLMVVGVDMDASQWQAELNVIRRGPILVAIGLLVVLSGGIGVFYFRSRRMKIHT